MKKKHFNNQGQILINVIVFGSIAIYFIGAFSAWAILNVRAARQTFNREQTIQIAEAGVDYYRWHLAHATTDFQDGTGSPGPYVHDFKDKNGNIIGRFSLNIIPPALGSSLVTIESTGNVGTSNVFRKIVVKLAKPSIAKYAIAANNVMRFGSGTNVFGPIQSNQGIRFDGVAYNMVSSAVSSYDDPDHTGGNEFGVHTHITPVDPLPPASVPQRTDVFKIGRQFPVPALDFVGIISDLAQMKSDAQVNGFYRSGSGALGYHVILKINDTFDLYKVTSFVNAPFRCTNTLRQTGWGTWSVNNQQLLGNYAFPLNGIIFFEDDVFVKGQINTARLTIVAAVLPDSPLFRKSIIVNNDVLYTNYDGTDTIGLIAQGNMNIGMVSEDDLRIDAALIAQNGRVGRHYYRTFCSPYHIRQTVTLLGMIATNERYGFAYTDGTGYQIRNLNYDSNLLYGPPPSFPLTSDQYTILTWEEEN